ncbi:uncharacterized protein N7479_000641 [Penicillium vulpinum]|uniref:AB hydrolase-1 domain-containing protein n=1 Tax=Penicillium vulpinum TaxID=29845 RepID=A0A1V6S6E0_9EURO|nr:uncharacterized protein N7479_000641 [Penicillium vulpinum]KAJ5970723.1 hypothetical protein N7479_000641 [Penicillium vulpinum]OQE09436.1 hypothetical protein PENVUL_c006G01162 [Penicillium vulpinum]
MAPIYYEEAVDQYVHVGPIRFAYRKFGAETGIPLTLLVHFRGTMDHWDPAFINPLGATRPIILIDNAGIGRSDGEVPLAIKDWAQNVINVLSAIEVKQTDLFGFSMGGFAAQLVALNAPQLIRRLILTGTSPSIGQGVIPPSQDPSVLMLKDAETEEDLRQAYITAFFGASQNCLKAGGEVWDRIASARKNRSGFLGSEGTNRQFGAFGNFLDPNQAKDGSFNRLHEINIPVLVAGGSNDAAIPTHNSYVLWQNLINSDAQLHIYADSGHGFLFQYAAEFSRLIGEFLDSV